LEHSSSEILRLGFFFGWAENSSSKAKNFRRMIRGKNSLGTDYHMLEARKHPVSILDDRIGADAVDLLTCNLLK
jgi:hypothetical protein